MADETRLYDDRNRASHEEAKCLMAVSYTHLVWKAYEDEPILYFFVARKAEGDLCEDYRCLLYTSRCV